MKPKKLNIKLLNNKRAFTIIEVIFSIVIFSIILFLLSKNLLTFSSLYLKTKSKISLNQKVENSLKILSKRLKFAIPSSIRVKTGSGLKSIEALSILDSIEYLEWVGIDNDGFRGLNRSSWSGFIDLNLSNKEDIYCAGSDLLALDKILNALSFKKVSLSDGNKNHPSIFFKDNSYKIDDFGYDSKESKALYEVYCKEYDCKNNILSFKDKTKKRVYEKYYLIFSAYKIELKDYNLSLYYNYQIWNNETYKNGFKTLILDDVDSLSMSKDGKLLKLKLCAKSAKSDIECKEKTVTLSAY